MSFLEIFLATANAVLPIVILIAIGYILRKIGFFAEGFLSGANKLIFRFAIPVMLFINVYRVPSLDIINWNVVWYIVGGTIVLFGLGLLSVLIFTKNNLQKGVILQGIVRCNFAIIGIPLVALLTNNDPQALMVTSVMTLFIIPTTSILSVIGLTIYSKGVDDNGLPIKQSIDWGYTLKKILTNPLIIGIVIGFAVVGIRPFVSGWTIQADLPFIYTATSQVAAMTAPLALIVMGGSFHFRSALKLMPQIIHGTLWRVIISPAIFITLAVVFRNQLGFDHTIFPGLIAVFASPVAVTSAVLAEELGNDGELAGQLVVWNSIVSIFSIFVVVMILMSMGLV